MYESHEQAQSRDFEAPTDYCILTEAEREIQFRRQHQEYLEEKLARKKQIARLRKAQFGPSSSDESSDDMPPSRSSGSSRRSSQQQPRVPADNSEHKGASSPPKQAGEQKIPANTLSKRGGEWVKDIVLYSGGVLTVLSIPIPVARMNKIKLIQEPTMSYSYRIKINYEEQESLFSLAVNNQEEKHGLPVNYYLFSRIIQDKLQAADVRLDENRLDKVAGIPETLINNSLIYGRLFKKSQVLGKWEERFIVINREGIYSYRKFNEKHSMHIGVGSVRELWTRFEVQDDMLIVKMMHNSKKTEFGLPLCHTLTRASWLFHFFGLMSPK